MGDWTISVISSMGYFGILLLMFTENVFPPIPSEVIMPLAGYLVSQGELTFAGIVMAGTAGSVLGALPLYYLGTKVDEEKLVKLADNYGRWLTLSGDDLKGANKWFDRHGGAAVFLCRLVPGIRSLISIPAGINRMPLTPFLAFTILGSAIWTSLLAYLGYLLSSNFSKVGEYIDPISVGVLGCIIAIYLVRVIRHKGRKASDS